MAVTIGGSGAFTGITSLNSSVSDTELGYVDGVTSAIQTQIDSKPTGGTGEWTDYTPVIKQSSSTPTFTKTVARYTQIGKTVFVNVRLAITSAGTAGSYITCSLPIAPKRNFYCILGTAGVVCNGVEYRAVTYSIPDTGAVFFVRTDTNATAPIGSDPNAALKNGDAVIFEATYEVA